MTNEPLTEWRAVVAFLKSFAGAEEDPPGGREVVRVRGKVLAFPARNDRSRPEGCGADEEFLVVKVDCQERAALLQEAPDAFFVTPHYQTYPGVIVRLAAVDQTRLRELLVDGWKSLATRQQVRAWEAERAATSTA